VNAFSVPLFDKPATGSINNGSDQNLVVCRKLMLRNRCGSNYCLFRDVVTRRDHMTRVFCDRSLLRNERIVHVELLVLSDKIVADKF